MDDGHDLPAAWQETLPRSKAQAERGESVPLEPFMDRLRASIDRMRAAREADQGEALTPEAWLRSARKP